jgi:FkbM family methyltransferase
MILKALYRLIRGLTSPKRQIKKLYLNSLFNKVNGVIHVGGNYGQESKFYNGKDLNVLWIEPIPEIFEQLNLNTKKFHNQKAINALITDKDDKEYVFNIANNKGGSSSIFKLKDHSELWPEVDYVKSINIKSTKLSSLVKHHNIDMSKYQFLVLDTQGSEMLVLNSAIPILKYFKYIKLEVANFEAYQGCCTLEDVYAFMKKNNYTEVGKYQFAGKKSKKYFDIVFKKIDE